MWLRVFTINSPIDREKLLLEEQRKLTRTLEVRCVNEQSQEYVLFVCLVDIFCFFLQGGMLAVEFNEYEEEFVVRSLW